jgi:hypothetical protein
MVDMPRPGPASNRHTSRDRSRVRVGNVVAQAGSDLMVFSTSIGGNLQDDHGASLAVEVTTIGDPLQVEHMTGLVSIGIFNQVTHNGLFFNNTGGVAIQGLNTFGGNLQINNNTGFTFVADNTVGNNLDCENNVPAPQPQPSSASNVAQHYGGQCA